MSCGPPVSRRRVDGTPTLAAHVAHEAEAIRHAMEGPVIDSVVELLAGARKVLVVGWRNSHPVALHLRQARRSRPLELTSASRPLPGQVIGEELVDLTSADVVVAVGFRRRPSGFGGFLAEAGGDRRGRPYCSPMGPHAITPHTRRTGSSARCRAPSPSTATPPR